MKHLWKSIKEAGLTMIYRLKFDGYGVADRLLDGVIFWVAVDVEGQEGKVREVVPDPSAFPYLNDIKWEPYAEAIEEVITDAIKNMKEYLEANNLTFEEDFAIWEEENEINEPGVQVLMEYVD